MEQIRVLIADDHHVYREGVRVLLHGFDDIAVVGVAADGDETLAKAEQLLPDVILMDLRMPGTSGIDATRRILARMPRVGILVVTMYEDDVSVFAAMRAGARGYLLKDADQSDLVRAVQAVYRGEAIFSPAIAQRLMRYFGALHRAAAPDSLAFPELTTREREILTLIAEGRNNAAITIQLGLSMKTVQNHISSIFGKLQVADRAQAIVRARDAGFRPADTASLHKGSFPWREA
jgi:DNA-binding NarL/FixJ family response regulator